MDAPHKRCITTFYRGRDMKLQPAPQPLITSISPSFTFIKACSKMVAQFLGAIFSFAKALYREIIMLLGSINKLCTVFSFKLSPFHGLIKKARCPCVKIDIFCLCTTFSNYSGFYEAAIQ